MTMAAKWHIRQALFRVPYMSFSQLIHPTGPVSWWPFPPFTDKDAWGLRDEIVCAESWLVSGGAEISTKATRLRSPYLSHHAAGMKPTTIYRWCSRNTCQMNACVFVC